jgi:uncharacterized protein YvpB
MGAMGCCGRWTGKKTESNPFREVRVNTADPHKGYKGNYTSTTKYNLLTFFPKALFEQYRWAAWSMLLQGVVIIPDSCPNI